ncbi:hypothetical protein AB832_00920 [Flavobacteriaceae bacterium (ex Bugula neritina AB1)]|nr:hypothetical protein AB832_00920 [Flavobacteriaceae bacterium (ex Bugula neritina AB1)]
MSISIWRYSHFLLAISSFVFLIIASITGIILAFEPIVDAIQPYRIQGGETISLSKAIVTLQNEYDEVITLSVDANDFVSASVITKEGTSEHIYINPLTAKNIGTPKDISTVFEFARNLHRSLFLKSTGRFFVGFISFLLCLITVTGFLLIIKRQGGIRRFFSKVQKEYMEQRYHVVLGRWLPILIIAATGVYLSAEKFSILPSGKVKHKIPIQTIQEPVIPVSEFSVFNNILLSEVRKISFPFSDDPEDYYQLELRDRELFVHQYSGTIISEIKYPFVVLATRLSLVLHTGEGSIIWSIILLISSCSILFFIYSGFVMTLRRRKKVLVPVEMKDKDECEYILLVGSETGNTYDFARLLCNALMVAQKNVFISELNNYTYYKKAEHIIVLTATYGEGEAPTNARKFEQLFKTIKQAQAIKFSIIGFGSTLYPQYCHFAIKVDELFNSLSVFKPVLPLYKINNQSFEAFKDWSYKWSKETGNSIVLQSLPKKMNSFNVVYRTAINEDSTFLIRLKQKKYVKFESGDLLSITPEDGVERLYSIARIDNDIVLSVKKHESGVCSSFLSQLNTKSKLKGVIKKNPNFHFPSLIQTGSVVSNESVIMIANGTGIAPFLGMLYNNEYKIESHLFWGGRTQKSFEIYKNTVDGIISQDKLYNMTIAYSREGKKEYVQDLIYRKSDFISEKLSNGSLIMICGSLTMQKGVLDMLAQITETKLSSSLEKYMDQIKMDCY